MLTWGVTWSVLCSKNTVLALWGGCTTTGKKQETSSGGLCKIRQIRGLPRVVRCGQILDTFWRLNQWGFLLDVELREGSSSAIKGEVPDATKA